jgi:hypothetical protein
MKHRGGGIGIGAISGDGGGSIENISSGSTISGVGVGGVDCGSVQVHIPTIEDFRSKF